MNAYDYDCWHIVDIDMIATVPHLVHLFFNFKPPSMEFQNFNISQKCNNSTIKNHQRAQESPQILKNWSNSAKIKINMSKNPLNKKNQQKNPYRTATDRGNKNEDLRNSSSKWRDEETMSKLSENLFSLGKLKLFS